MIKLSKGFFWHHTGPPWSAGKHLQLSTAAKFETLASKTKISLNESCSSWDGRKAWFHLTQWRCFLVLICFGKGHRGPFSEKFMHQLSLDPKKGKHRHLHRLKVQPLCTRGNQKHSTHATRRGARAPSSSLRRAHSRKSEEATKKKKKGGDAFRNPCLARCLRERSMRSTTKQKMHIRGELER